MAPAHFRHSKIEYDPRVNWKEVCAKLFEDRYKYLCVAEKLDVNAHVHLQGFTCMGDKEWDKLCRDLLADHYKLQDPKARPIRHSRKEVTDKGFQYMCKEDPFGNKNILARNLFTDGELLELYEKSEEHVKELKEGLRDYLFQKVPLDEDPAKLHAEYRLAGIDYYLEQDKMPPPNFQKHILWAMAKTDPPCKRRKIYVSERI